MKKKEGRQSLEASRRFRLSLTEALTLWEYGVFFPSFCSYIFYSFSGDTLADEQVPPFMSRQQEGDGGV